MGLGRHYHWRGLSYNWLTKWRRTALELRGITKGLYQCNWLIGLSPVRALRRKYTTRIVLDWD